MNKVKENNFYKWSADKGDYKRDDDATTSSSKKRIWRRRIKKSLWIFLYFIIVIAISYFIFAEL